MSDGMAERETVAVPFTALEAGAMPGECEELFKGLDVDTDELVFTAYLSVGGKHRGAESVYVHHAATDRYYRVNLTDVAGALVDRLEDGEGGTADERG